MKDGRMGYCIGCDNKYRREFQMRALYGVTPQQYAALLERQGDVCAICQRPETRTDKTGNVYRLSVDHCHETGRVRGLLCRACNSGIGLFSDDDDRLERAARYLRHHALPL
jgi:hypothetical protein